jgi:protein disulfide-isomerase A6
LLPDWHAASRQLHGHGVQLGLVDATVETELAQQYGVQGYPTIKLFSGIGPTARKKSLRTATTYEGGRTKDQIIFGALDEVEKSGGFIKEILELTSPQVLEEVCEGEDNNKLCLVVALPHILESGVAGRAKYLTLMQNVTRAVLSSGVAAPFEFVWFEGGNAQTALENQLELTFGYPAVAAVSIGKEAYAIHRGPFSQDKLKGFLNGILSGRQKVSPLNTKSAGSASPDGLTVSRTEPWDGSEGTPPDEDDLADIMGDDWQSDL